MVTLRKKLFQDIKHNWKSFVAIILICLLAVTLYVGIDATWRCIDLNVSDQIDESNMSDLWVRGENTDRDVRNIEALPGVQTAQRRLKVEARASDFSHEPRVDLIMSDGNPLVDKMIVDEGKPLSSLAKDECVVQRWFAEANRLAIGDIVQLSIGNRSLSLIIAGLGTMPEYVVTSNGNELAPSSESYGYAVVAPGTLGDKPYTEIAVKLALGADVAAVKQSVEELMRDRQIVAITREDVSGIKMAMEEAQQIRAMGQIFPLVFFLIAALITWTTMSRLVENQRLIIGSLLATGYTHGELVRHYAGYGLIIAVLGSVLGLLGARFGIAPILMSFIKGTYVLPGVIPSLNVWVVLAVFMVLATITCGAAMLSARLSLKTTPAELLRPKPPGMGKRIIGEGTALWNRLQFSSKMVLRNLLRNPSRLIMGLIGAMGCAAMMVAGFGLRDTVSNVMEAHCTQTLRYDARITMASDLPHSYIESLATRVNATYYEEEMQTTTEVFTHGEWRSKPVYVYSNDSELIHLSDERGHGVPLPAAGVVLSKQAAGEYGWRDGQPIYLRMPGGRAVETQIVAIAELQLEQGIYLSRSAWDALELYPFMATDILLRGPNLHLASVADMDGVEKAKPISEEREGNEALLEIMNVIVVLLVLFSGALALAVFYNVGQLNFSERIRELATLRVLGFTKSEMKKLVLRENIIITSLGLPFGFMLGPFLHRAVLNYGLPQTIQFIPYIAPISWALVAILTVGFAMLVNVMLGSKFKGIVMVEALKSVE